MKSGQGGTWGREWRHIGDTRADLLDVSSSCSLWTRFPIPGLCPRTEKYAPQTSRPSEGARRRPMASAAQKVAAEDAPAWSGPGRGACDVSHASAGRQSRGATLWAPDVTLAPRGSFGPGMLTAASTAGPWGDGAGSRLHHGEQQPVSCEKPASPHAGPRSISTETHVYGMSQETLRALSHPRRPDPALLHRVHPPQEPLPRRPFPPVPAQTWRQQVTRQEGPSAGRSHLCALRAHPHVRRQTGPKRAPCPYRGTLQGTLRAPETSRSPPPPWCCSENPS